LHKIFFNKLKAYFNKRAGQKSKVMSLRGAERRSNPLFDFVIANYPESSGDKPIFFYLVIASAEASARSNLFE